MIGFLEQLGLAAVLVLFFTLGTALAYMFAFAAWSALKGKFEWQAKGKSTG